MFEQYSIENALRVSLPSDPDELLTQYLIVLDNVLLCPLDGTLIDLTPCKAPTVLSYSKQRIDEVCSNTATP